MGAALLASGLVIVPLVVGDTYGAPSCAMNGTTAEFTLDGANDTLFITSSGQGGNVSFSLNGAVSTSVCGSTTLSMANAGPLNVIQVRATAAGNQTVTIDLAGAATGTQPFGPGADSTDAQTLYTFSGDTTEDEVEFDIDLGAGGENTPDSTKSWETGDRVIINGHTSSNDFMTFAGSATLGNGATTHRASYDGTVNHTDSDPDPDYFFTNVEQIQFQGNGGNDSVATGNNATPNNVGGSSADRGSLQFILLGGAGTDSLISGAANDYIDGGADNDPSLDGQGGEDIVVGGSGNDGTTQLTGNNGADVLVGGTGTDLNIRGGTGDDYIWEGDSANGDDTMGVSNASAAEAGFDTVSYYGRTGGVDVTMTNAVPANTCNSGANTTGNGEGAENDTIGHRIEHIIGGSGDDNIDVSGACAAVGTGTNAGFDTAENWVTPGAGNDTVVGGGTTTTATTPIGTFIDFLNYGPVPVGMNRINAAAGYTSLNPTFVNQFISFALTGNSSAYTVVPTGEGFAACNFGGDTSADGVVVDLANSPFNTQCAGTETVSGMNGIIGTLFNDRLTGNANGNSISGLDGNDVIDGAAGDDNIRSTQGIWYQTSLPQAHTGTWGVLVPTFTNTDQCTACPGVPTDFGLNGDKGNDTITGGAGVDTISGGAGNDTFPQGTGADGGDQVSGGPDTTGDSVIYTNRLLSVWRATREGRPTSAVGVTMTGIITSEITTAAFGFPGTGNDGDPAVGAVQNEIQTVTFANVTGGTWNFSYGGISSSTITWSAGLTAATVQTALTGMSTIGTGDATVTGSNGGPFTITYGGYLLRTNIVGMTANNALTGTNPTVTLGTTQDGGDGESDNIWSDVENPKAPNPPTISDTNTNLGADGRDFTASWNIDTSLRFGGATPLTEQRVYVLPEGTPLSLSIHSAIAGWTLTGAPTADQATRTGTASTTKNSAGTRFPNGGTVWEIHVVGFIGSNVVSYNPTLSTNAQGAGGAFFGEAGTLGAAAKVVFTEQPSNVTAGATMSPSVVAQVQDNVAGRVVTGATTNLSTTVTKTAGSDFAPIDLGRGIAGAGIPNGATIASITSGTAIVLSVAATATASGVTLTLGATNNTCTDSVTICSGGYDASHSDPDNGFTETITASIEAYPTYAAPFTGATATDSTNTINQTAHGLSNGNKVRLTALTGGAGLNTTTNYFVVNSTANTYQLSTTSGGSAIDITSDSTGSVNGYTFTVNGVSGAEATNLFTKTAHGLSVGNQVRLNAVTGGTGLVMGTTYFVLSTGFTTSTFKLGTTASDPSEVDFTTTNATDVAVIKIGVLSGTVTRPIDWTCGCATFTDFAVDKVGTAYILKAVEGFIGPTSPLTDADTANSAASSPFNVTSGAPASLFWTLQPSDPTQPSTNFSVTVQVQDSSGNPALDPSVDETERISLSFDTPDALSVFGEVADQLLDIGAPTNTNNVAVTPQGDVLWGSDSSVTFSNLNIDEPGTPYQFKALYDSASTTGGQDGTIPNVNSNAFTIAASGAFVFTDPAADNSPTKTAGDFTVTVQLQATGGAEIVSEPGTVDAGDETVTITCSGPGAFGNRDGGVTTPITSQTFTFTGSPGGGEVTFLVRARVAGTYNCTTTTPTGWTTDPTQGARTILVVAGPPADIAWSTQPTTNSPYVAGASITGTVNPFAVQVVDQFGNAVADNARPINLTFVANPSVGGLGVMSNATANTNAGGLATFGTLSINKVGDNYTILGNATISGAVDTGTSTNFDIIAGAPDHLTFITPPTNTVASAIINSPGGVVVRVEDINGNPITTDPDTDGTTDVEKITLSYGANPCGSPGIDGTLQVAIVWGTGSTYTTLDIDEACNAYTFVATYDNGTGGTGGMGTTTSPTFNITAGAPNNLQFFVQPSNSVAGVNISPSIVVRLRDASNNPITTDPDTDGTTDIEKITLSMGANPCLTGVLDGTLQIPVVWSTGSTYSTINIDKACDSYTVIATYDNGTGANGGVGTTTSATFNITAGPAKQLIWSVQPTSTVAGQPIDSPAGVQVRVADQFGNTVKTDPNGTANDEIITIAKVQGTGTLSAASLFARPIDWSDGLTDFPGLSIDLVGIDKILRATASGGAISTLVSSGMNNTADSNVFPITAGLPAGLFFRDPIPDDTVNSPLGTGSTVVVEVRDALGNIVTTDPTGSGTSDIVTLSRNNGGTCPAVLGGTLGVQVDWTTGTITYTNATMNAASSNCTLTATKPAGSTWTNGLSDEFNITSGPNLHLPFITIDVTPNSPKTLETVTATILTFGDLDAGDVVNWTYKWYVNGILRRTLANTTSMTDVYDLAPDGKGDLANLITAVVTPFDGRDVGADANETVQVVNTTPTATARTASVAVDKPMVIALAGSDPDNQSLMFRITSLPAHGTLSYGSGPTIITGATPLPVELPNFDNLVTFTPGAGNSTATSFDFQAADVIGSTPDWSTNTATVSITMNAPGVNPATQVEGTQSGGNFPVTATTDGTQSESQPVDIQVEVARPAAFGSVSIVVADETVARDISGAAGTGFQQLSVQEDVTGTKTDGALVITPLIVTDTNLTFFTLTFTLDNSLLPVPLDDTSVQTVKVFRDGAEVPTDCQGGGTGAPPTAAVDDACVPSGTTGRSLVGGDVIIVVHTNGFSDWNFAAPLAAATSILLGPQGATNANSPNVPTDGDITFTFTSAPIVASYQCSLSRAGDTIVILATTSCATGSVPANAGVVGGIGRFDYDVGALPDDLYTFRVQATIGGNIARRDFVIDRTAPSVTITSGPADGATITVNTATYGYSSNDVAATFSCQLDLTAFVACTPSPRVLTGIANGAHTFSVEARDAANNTSVGARTLTVAVPGGGGGGGGTPPTTTKPRSTNTPLRIAGEDRTQTAELVSRVAFPNGADVVYIATDRDYADALSAGPGAVSETAPVLLTQVHALDDNTASELTRLQPKRIVVMGGYAAVDDDVFELLRPYASVEIVRIAGVDRFGTAAMLSQDKFPDGVDVVYLATGRSYPDALAGGLAASTEGSPVLLTEPNVLPQVTADELLRLHPSRVVIVGGTGAVARGLEALLADYAPVVERIAGADRYETTANVGRLVVEGTDTVFIVTGKTFGDALTGIPVAALTKSAVLMVGDGPLNPSVIAELVRLKPKNIIILGGSAAVAQRVEEQLAEYIGEGTGDGERGLQIDAADVDAAMAGSERARRERATA